MESQIVSEELVSFYAIQICGISNEAWEDFLGASLGAQAVKILPVMWETRVLSLDWEDPLEKGMATHSSILAWGDPMDRGAWQATIYGIAQSQTYLKWLSKQARTTWCICHREGNSHFNR